MKARQTLIIACVALGLSATFAQAKSRPAELEPADAFIGFYTGGDDSYQQDLQIQKRPEGGYDISLAVGTSGCGGSVDAQGTVAGNLLKATVQSDDGQMCLLTLKRSKNGMRVTNENCGYFHGPSCEFTGKYQKK